MRPVPSTSRFRLRAAALSLALVVGIASAAASQEAQAQQQAQPQQPQGTMFNLDAGVAFFQIKPDKTAEFEAVVAKLKEALAKSEDQVQKQQAAGWKVFKAQEPAPGGNVFYLFVIHPSVKSADYSVSAILKILYAAFPAEGQDLYKKLTESMAGGRSVLNLSLVSDFGK